MRLQISRSKNSASLYVIKSTYINKVHSTQIVEKLGTEAELREKLNGADPYVWAKEYIKNLNEEEKLQKRNVTISYSQSKFIEQDEKRLFNGGYLFLQQIYNELGLEKICKDISKKYDFKYNLNSILSRLIYGRVLFPASKLATNEFSKKYIEQPDFDAHQIYRALSVIANESDYIQKEVYNNSLASVNRDTRVIYYDCTNYFFEIEEADIDGDRQYGKSKENRPNPIVQMGLFMDADGIPLSFDITPGNTNEQVTLKPLEKKLISDFKMSKFVVCTDAGLASNANRKFNDVASRAFITTQSIKKLKGHLKEWSLDPTGWKLSGSNKFYDLSTLDETADYNKNFYKERWINENDLEQKLIVTYSLKYKNYQAKIRNNQIERAITAIDKNPSKLEKTNPNDFRRFINSNSVTTDGEIASKKIHSINDSKIREESMYDGFYAVCTNLEDDASSIIKINQRRWEIEECFRIMKTEFEARPVYLQRKERIKAHFMTCFLALTIYRILEKKTNEQFTTEQLLTTLREMDFLKVRGEGYIPTYTRTEITNTLHDTFKFRTDTEIISNEIMKKIIKSTQKPKTLRKKIK